MYFIFKQLEKRSILHLEIFRENMFNYDSIHCLQILLCLSQHRFSINICFIESKYIDRTYKMFIFLESFSSRWQLLQEFRNSGKREHFDVQHYHIHIPSTQRECKRSSPELEASVQFLKLHPVSISPRQTASHFKA